MTEAIWGVLLPSGLALAGVTFTALVGKRKNATDGQLGFIAVLQAERAASDGRADKAEAKLARSDARARRFEALAWKYHQLLLRSDLDPIPAWPTEETERVTA